MTDPIRISIGGYQGPCSVHTRALISLQESLHRLAGGRVDVDLRPNVTASGHLTADLPDLVKRGELDACYISSSYLADTVPALSLFDIPFAAPDRDQAFAQLDGALGVCFKQEIKARTGLELLGIWDNGVRHVSTASRPLRQPSQCAGLVLRTLPSADHQRVFRSLGFDPRVVDAKDLPDAVARGDVDAQENPLTNTYNFGLHKTLPMITKTGHLMGIVLVLFNRERFLAWPKDIRAAVVTAVAEASRAQREMAHAEDEASAQALLKEGATLIELTQEEHNAWRAATEVEAARSRARLDPELLAMFETGNLSEEKSSA